MSAPKILALDIETAPHLGYFFGTFNININIDMIMEPTYTLCWAAKWLGEKKVEFMTCQDEDFIETIWDMLNEADAVIHYNGKQFDMKHLNREFLLAGLPPPSPYKNVDLLSTIRTNFKFASNKLAWTSLEMGYEGKVNHRGIQLWFDCMANNANAWKEMKSYNVQDVQLLEEMFEDLKPWITSLPNYALWTDNEEETCKNCGSTDMQRRGYQRTAARIYQRWQCNSCAKWQRSAKQDKRSPKGSMR